MPSGLQEVPGTARTGTVARRNPEVQLQIPAPPAKLPLQPAVPQQHPVIRQLPVPLRPRQVKRPINKGNATDAEASMTTRPASIFPTNARSVAQWDTRDITAKSQHETRVSSPWCKTASSRPPSPILPRAHQPLAPRCDSQARAPEDRTSGAKQTPSRTPDPITPSSTHHLPDHRASSFKLRTLAALSVSTTLQSTFLALVK